MRYLKPYLIFESSDFSNEVSELLANLRDDGYEISMIEYGEKLFSEGSKNYYGISIKSGERANILWSDIYSEVGRMIDLTKDRYIFFMIMLYMENRKSVLVFHGKNYEDPVEMPDEYTPSVGRECISEYHHKDFKQVIIVYRPI